MLKCYSSTVQNCIISETDVGWRELIENGQLQQFISLDIWLWSTIGIEHVCKLRVRAPKLISTVPYIAPHPEVSNLILYPIPSTYSTRVLHLFDMAFLYHTGKNTLSSLRKDIKFHKRNWKQADTKPLRRILNPWEETECLGFFSRMSQNVCQSSTLGEQTSWLGTATNPKPSLFSTKLLFAAFHLELSSTHSSTSLRYPRWLPL